MPETLSDEALLEAWRRGGDDRERAFRCLYERFAAELAGTFRNKMRLDPETCRDLVQETLLQVSRSLDQFREKSSLRTWIHTIGHRVALHHLRSLRTSKRRADVVSLDAPQSSEGDAPPREAPDDAPDAHRQLKSKERLRDAKEAIDRLPLGDRTIFRFFLEEMSLREISRLVGKPPGTVKSTIFRVRRKLDRELKAVGWDLPRLEDEE